MDSPVSETELRRTGTVARAHVRWVLGHGTQRPTSWTRREQHTSPLSLMTCCPPRASGILGNDSTAFAPNRDRTIEGLCGQSGGGWPGLQEGQAPEGGPAAHLPPGAPCPAFLTLGPGWPFRKTLPHRALGVSRLEAGPQNRVLSLPLSEQRLLSIRKKKPSLPVQRGDLGG